MFHNTFKVKRPVSGAKRARDLSETNVKKVYYIGCCTFLFSLKWNGEWTKMFMRYSV